MSFDVEQFVRYQISNAQLRTYPFPHFYVHPVFPPDFYDQLLAHLPPTEILSRIGEGGSVGKLDADGNMISGSDQPRYIGDLAVLEEHEQSTSGGDLWAGISQWLLGDEFRDLIIGRFEQGVRERFGSDVKLRTQVDGRYVRDFTKYSIGPHTDTPRKLVSLLFYLPRDESMRHLGTSIYSPIDPEFRCEGNRWHDFGSFRKIATMEFLPNSLLGFFKTDRSFHGVEVIDDADIERNVLLYNIYVNKVITRGPAKAAAAPAGRWWPWARGAQH